MFQAVAEDRISKPMILEIKLEVVSRPGVRFCDSNATSNDNQQTPFELFKIESKEMWIRL